jgi:hypothetical protein
MDISTKTDFSPGSPARQKINKEFNLPKWELFRKWYFRRTVLSRGL